MASLRPRTSRVSKARCDAAMIRSLGVLMVSSFLNYLLHTRTRRGKELQPLFNRRITPPRPCRCQSENNQIVLISRCGAVGVLNVLIKCTCGQLALDIKCLLNRSNKIVHFRRAAL